jgi:NhaP-type Na+/H+ or K+/H+ antiporter
MQIYLYLFILSGVAIAAMFDVHGIQNEQSYLLTIATLLGIGLFSSTFGISLPDARKHLVLIVKAVTVGVLLKALIIGAVMSLVLQSAFGFILGIIVAQIDPLATAVLMKGNRMSKHAQTILRAWSSFDDPMTVLLSLCAPVVIAFATGTTWHPIQNTAQDAGLAGYLVQVAVNLGFVAGVFVLWRLIKRRSGTANYVLTALVALGMYGLFIGALSVAIYYFLMLGIAILGLFMRPPIDKAISHALQWALYVAAILLGILLLDGINIWKGFALGLAAYISQILVGLLLTRKLERRDRLHIAFAQQNGITAIILALLFEAYYPGTVSIVGPAIITINIIYVIANRLLDTYLDKDSKSLKSAHYPIATSRTRPSSSKK